MNLLILDEPTNHLDIASREALEDALVGYDGTLIAVSHDRYFIDKLATRIITLGETPVKDFRGTYHEYAEYQARLAETSETSESEDRTTENKSDSKYQTVTLTGKEAYLEKKKNAAEERKQKKHMEVCAAKSKSFEAELVTITDELFGDAAYDYMRAAELEDRRITVEDRLMSLYEEEESFEDQQI